MNFRTVRRAAGVILLVLSLALLSWGLWPVATEIRQTNIDPVAMLSETPELAAATSRLGQQQLALEYPVRLRVGDIATIQVQLASAEATPSSYSGTVGSAILLVEARLEAAGLEYRPAGEISEAWLPGKPARFSWTIRAQQAGVYPLTLWLHLRAVSPQGASLARKVISAQRIEIRAVDLFGFNGPASQAVAGVGIVIGAALALDGLLDWAAKWYARRKAVP